MCIETKRIYKITEDNFYGITQGTRPIVDDEGNITGQVQNPVATIRYDDRLITVEPYQVEFIEEQESGVVWHTGDGVSVSVDDEREYRYCEGYADYLDEMLEEQKQTMADKIISYSMSFEDESMMCNFIRGDEGNRTLMITWKEE